MKYAIISDIHGNYPALQAVMEDIKDFLNFIETRSKLLPGRKMNFTSPFPLQPLTSNTCFSGALPPSEDPHATTERTIADASNTDKTLFFILTSLQMSQLIFI